MQTEINSINVERMRLPFFCRGSRFAEKEETVIHFLCQYLRLSVGADIGYLIHHFLSAWRSCHLLMIEYSFVYQTIWLIFQHGVVMLLIGNCRADQLLLWLFSQNLVRTTGRYACSSELCDIRATTPS